MITIHNPTININLAQTEMARALFAALLRGDEPEASAPVPTHHVVGRPLIGQYFESQGGIFAGDFHGGDGSIYGLIVATEQDIGRATWGANGERDLSDWDGLANTKALRKDCPAAKLAAEYTRDGHDDFYLPSRRELLLGAANLHDLPKSRMVRLTELGVIRHHGGGYYSITAFGRLASGGSFARLPLETVDERNDRISKEHQAAIAARAAQEGK